MVSEREFEDNILFDRNRELESAGQMLRVRTRGSRSELTFKGIVPGEHRHKVRTEHETAVESPAALAKVLEGLGYSPAYRYQKFRTRLQLEGLEVAIDETPIGCFVELEGEPPSIDAVAARLGFSDADYIKDTYFDLHRRAIAAGESPSGDLVFDDERPAR